MSQLRNTNRHDAGHPSWDCLACGQPWPCNMARDALKAVLDRMQLAVYMWARFDEAVNELPPHLPSELFKRFLKWTS
jgi:hypothetical protein